MVLLAAVWLAGWFISPANLFADTDAPLLLALLTALVLAAWNLLGCVIAAGFFHAASRHPAMTFRGFRAASLRLTILGILFLFPVPLMAQVLGSSPQGRALALLVTAMSLAAVVFARARIRLIARRLALLEELSKLAPLQ